MNQDDLHHDPTLFDSRAWLRITNSHGAPAYRVMAVELEAKPRSRRPDKAATETKAQFIRVWIKAPGRTGPRTCYTFKSLSQAMKALGRRVRSSLDAGRKVEGVVAKRVWLRKIDGKVSRARKR